MTYFQHDTSPYYDSSFAFQEPMFYQYPLYNPCNFDEPFQQARPKRPELAYPQLPQEMIQHEFPNFAFINVQAAQQIPVSYIGENPPCEQSSAIERAKYEVIQSLRQDDYKFAAMKPPVHSEIEKRSDASYSIDNLLNNRPSAFQPVRKIAFSPMPAPPVSFVSTKFANPSPTALRAPPAHSATPVSATPVSATPVCQLPASLTKKRSLIKPATPAQPVAKRTRVDERVILPKTPHQPSTPLSSMPWLVTHPSAAKASPMVPTVTHKYFETPKLMSTSKISRKSARKDAPSPMRAESILKKLAQRWTYFRDPKAFAINMIRKTLSREECFVRMSEGAFILHGAARTMYDGPEHLKCRRMNRFKISEVQAAVAPTTTKATVEENITLDLDTEDVERFVTLLDGENSSDGLMPCLASKGARAASRQLNFTSDIVFPKLVSKTTLETNQIQYPIYPAEPAAAEGCLGNIGYIPNFVDNIPPISSDVDSNSQAMDSDTPLISGILEKPTYYKVPPLEIDEDSQEVPSIDEDDEPEPASPYAETQYSSQNVPGTDEKQEATSAIDYAQSVMDAIYDLAPKCLGDDRCEERYCWCLNTSDSSDDNRDSDALRNVSQTSDAARQESSVCNSAEDDEVEKLAQVLVDDFRADVGAYYKDSNAAKQVAIWLASQYDK